MTMKPADFRDQAYLIGIPIRVQELQRELRTYQRDAPSLFLSETPIEILRPEHRTNGLGGERVNGNGNGNHYTGESTARILATRAKTAALLQWIAKLPRTQDAVRAHGGDGRVVSVLIRAGHVTLKNGILRRTTKPFIVNKTVADKQARHAAASPAPQKKRYGKAVVKKREQSASLIASFDTETPQAPPKQHPAVGALGSLVRRGYLVQRGKGLYVRTGKQYVIARA
jgi:hypothetical protein